MALPGCRWGEGVKWIIKIIFQKNKYIKMNVLEYFGVFLFFILAFNIMLPYDNWQSKEYMIIIL